MNVPIPTARVTPLIACIAIMVMAAAYLVFLIATWNEYKNNIQFRDSKINELLDRLPKKATAE